MNWIKSIFGGLDRSQAAVDRVASALEGLADDLETVRARLRERLGLDKPQTPAQEIPRGAIPLQHQETQRPEPAPDKLPNGRTRKAVARG